MGTLGQLGVTGLLAVNSWMSTISANINGASRTAYKPTRVSLLDGSVNLQGSLQIPQPTLRVQATTLEWAQGSITNSDSASHFALQGQGFFVLADDAGRYYLTRDGEFHWDGLGYLRNSNGLRVLSNGQDFVRRGRDDNSDIFDADGESLELARYGDKSLLIVDVANRDGLKFSRYGATVFEVDGDLPLRIENDFDTSTDGLSFIYSDPKQLPYVGNYESPTFVPFDITDPAASDFSIRLGNNGVFNFATQTGSAFDPDVNTIQDVVDAINQYGIDNNADIFAAFDPASDRIEIRNIAEPKVTDPGFRVGNFAIDLGDNGFFTYRDFDPARTSIAQIVAEINRYGVTNGVNVTASFNTVTRQLSINNSVVGPGDNSIRFDGANGSAIADFFNVNGVTASTGGGAQTITSTSNIDNNPPSANAFAQITAVDAAGMPLGEMVRPKTRIRFEGGNGEPLEAFFQLTNAVQQDDALNGLAGTRIQSRQDIDNSRVLSSGVLAEHSLDIEAADLAVKTFNTYLSTTDASTPTNDPSGPPSLYSHDKVNNIVISDGRTNNGRGLIGISHAQTTSQFDLVMDFKVDSAPNNQPLELHFGQQRAEQIDSGGYTLKYDPANGQVQLFQREKNPNNPPVLIQSLPPGTLPSVAGLAGSPHRFAVRLDSNGRLELSVDGVSASFNVVANVQERTGYVTLGHYPGGYLEIYNMYADFKALYNHDATGGMISTSIKSYARREVNSAISNQNGTRVQQSALESSIASLTEYIPMLGLAQKMFSSLSKIISVNNALQDDINSLLR
jgi:flagellar basal body rod protein FlgG